MRKYRTVYITLLLFCLTIGSMLLGFSSSAEAEYFNPHGNYNSTTEGCATCHITHVSVGERLLPAGSRKELCYTCHDGSKAINNVRAEFGEQTINTSVYTSYHWGTSGPQDCLVCHNPHLGNNEKAQLLEVGPSKVSSGNAVCGVCHGVGSTAPGENMITPFTGTAHDTEITSPVSGTQIKCSRCHQPHGSPYSKMIRTSINDQNNVAQKVYGNDNTACFACHPSALRNYSGQDVYQQTVHGQTYATTNARTSYPGTTYQPSQCLNCHEPHGKAGLSKYLRAPGNTLCTNCHDDGSVVRPGANYSYRGITSYNASMHSTVAATAYRVTGDCQNCHNPHGQKDALDTYIPKQLKMTMDKVCFGGGSGCHTDSKNSIVGVSVYQRFTIGTDPTSRHSIDPSEQAANGTKIECRNCHGAHLDNPVSRVVYPDNIALSYPLLNTMSQYFGPNGEVYFMAAAKHDGRPPVITTGPNIFVTADDRATVTWTTDEPTTGEITLKNINTGVSTVVYSLSGVNTNHTAYLTGMIVLNRYTFVVKAIDTSGNTTEATETDVDGVAPTINAPGPVITMGADSATITWNTNERSNSIVEWTPDSSYSVDNYVYSVTYNSLTTSHTVLI
ncbi:MAG TPA: cytochrome c3 family protein, partial [Bacillota bacterium]|nr:cytochrome c3 family protein [Bacillota bacterium]